MTNWNRENRREKGVVTEFMVGAYEQKHGAIFLPGWSEDDQIAGLCIRHAIDAGSLDPSKPIYAVERDPDMAFKIKADLETLGLEDLRFHAGHLDTLKVTTPIDLAYIDLMGGLDEATCVWFRDQVAPNIVPDGSVGVTLSYAIRRNSFMRKAREAFQTTFADYYAAAKDRYKRMEDERLVPILLLRAAFRDLNPRLDAQHQYRDSRVPMILFSFKDFNSDPVDAAEPTLAEILAVIRGTTVLDGEGGFANVGGPQKSWAVRHAETTNALSDLQAQVAGTKLELRFDPTNDTWSVVAASRPDLVFHSGSFGDIAAIYGDVNDHEIPSA